jgi:hypothetical protein
MRLWGKASVGEGASHGRQAIDLPDQGPHSGHCRHPLKSIRSVAHPKY